MLIVTDLIHFTQSPQMLLRIARNDKGAKSLNPLRLCILSLRPLHETLFNHLASALPKKLPAALPHFLSASFAFYLLSVFPIIYVYG